jgi:threonine dehydrogenase-like Zn-dependent dehydrogenase
MKALYYDGHGGLEWREDPSPSIEGPSDALVRPVAVSTCDLDQAIVRGAVPGAEQPFALGHEGVGEVVEVGPDVRSFARGDLVTIPYHLSCGRCDRCAEQLPLYCRETAAEQLAVYGIPVGADHGGLFSDLIRVPFAEHSLLKLPEGVTPLQAVSVGDNLTDAWRAVAPYLLEWPGSDLLILGSGSIGLFAADIARACGAGLVRYVDKDPARRELAARLGAEPLAPEEFSRDAHRYELTLNATSDTSGSTLRKCLLATAPGGRCESTVFHFADVEVPLIVMHLNCLTLRSSLANVRPHMPAVLEMLSRRRIDPELVTTDVLPFDTAAEALPRAGFKPVFTREPLYGASGGRPTP